MKTPIIRIDDAGVLRYADQAATAQTAYLRVMRARWPAGADVRWSYQGAVQSGTVLAWAEDGETLQVRNEATEAEYWISPRAIAEALRHVE